MIRRSISKIPPRLGAASLTLALALSIAPVDDARAAPREPSADASAPGQTQAPTDHAPPAATAPMSSPPAATAPMSSPPTATAPMSDPDAPPELPSDSSDAPTATKKKKKNRKSRRKRSGAGNKGNRNTAEPVANAADPLAKHRPVQVSTGKKSQLTIAGTLETFYAFNFNRPSNGITNFRAFDDQHNSITLQNAAIDLFWSSERVYARIALQSGHTPEIASAPAPLSLDEMPQEEPSLFRNIQRAYAGAHPFANAPVFIEAGIFLSPIGYEGITIQENWHWSHSPIFLALPFYHSGFKIGADIGPAHRIKFAVYNGWNNIRDNNPEKSLALEYGYTPGPRFSLAAVYFTGVERDVSAPEGRAWRHVVNVAARGTVHPRLGLVGDFNAGIEPNLFGSSRWIAANAGLRAQALPWLFVAGRGTIVGEHRANIGGLASPIVLANFTDDPQQWMGAATLTLDLRPVPDHFALKLEYRHDQARSNIFFQGTVAGSGTVDDRYITNARGQDTLTLGLHAWF